MAEPKLTAAERRLSLVAVIACIGVVGVTMGLTYPLLSLLLEARGTSRTLIGLNAAMPALAMLGFSPLIPRLVAAFRLRPFLIGCIVIEATMIVTLKAVDDVYAWFPIRFVMGASGVGLFTAAETWINQIAEDKSRGRLMAVYTVLLSASFASGPLIILVTGIEGWAPFLLGVVFVLLGAIPLLWAGHLAPVFEGTASFGVLSFVRVAPTLAAAMLVFAAIESVASVLLPVYGVRSGLAEGTAALTLTVVLLGSLAMQFPIGWLADKVDRHAVLLGLGAASGVTIVLLPWVVHDPPLLWAILFAWGGLAAGIYTVALVILGQRFRGAELITANAAFGVLWGVGSMAGPALGGVAMDLWDPHGLPVVLAASSAVLVVVVIVALASRRAG